MSQQTMNGLLQFIKDIRQCKNKEQEYERVAKELAKIRGKFENKGISGYQRKKYVWKMLYIYILGYEIDFGHFQAANLINSSKFSEKYTGYIATGILVNENNNELYKTVAGSIRQDLESANEINQSLAISMVGSLAPKELSDQLDKEIIKIAIGERNVQPQIRKKAVLCLLRIFRKYNEKYNPTPWAAPTVKMFEGRPFSLGYLSAASSFVLGVSSLSTPDLFVDVIPKVIKQLQKIVLNKECSNDYLYYQVPNPWLQIKLLKILQMYPLPQDENLKKILLEILKTLINVDVTKSVNRNNVNHGILFEATSLLIHYGDDIPKKRMDEVIKRLGVFISVREPNFKYLGLETMCKLVHNNEDLVEKHLSTILKSLKSNDISIKRRALDLLYLMCTQNTAKRIVDELLAYAEEKVDIVIKEELVLKIAILAEKFADNLIWYIDSVIKLITSSGDFVTDDIWFRIIQMIVGFGKEPNPELQKYAALKLYASINIPHAHENLIRIAAFVISEYSPLLVEEGKDPQKLFDVLNRHFSLCSEKGRQMILNGYAKLAARFPQLRGNIQSVFQNSSEHFDPDLQQRGVEYNTLLDEPLEVQQLIFSKQPPYSQDIQEDNSLIKRIYKLKMGSKQEQKDPTIALENQRRAQETVQFMTKSAVTPATANTPQTRTTLSAHLDILKNNVLYDINPAGVLVTGSNIIAPPLPLQAQSNFVQLKALLSANIGQILDTNELLVQYKSDYQQHMGKIAMQFESKVGKMEKVNFSIINQEQCGLDFNISPVKYDAHPQIMMQVMSTDLKQLPPTALLTYEVNGAQKKIEIGLPILTNKFMQRVDMDQSFFDKFWAEYSQGSNATSYKLDSYIPNPANLTVSLHDLLKRAGSLFSSVLGLKVMALPDMNNIQTINGVGQVAFKDVEKNSTKSAPVMIQMQGSDAYKEHVRFSLRGVGSPYPISVIYQIVLNFMGIDK